VPTADPLASGLIDRISGLHLTLAVAESLTGGLVIARLVAVPGASAVVLGGIVAYSSELKHSVLGVDVGLLVAEGPVHPQVAEQMADRVRTVLGVGGRRADIGLATTGVAGPGAEGSHPAGTVYIALAVGDSVRSLRLSLSGDRQAIREQTASELLFELNEQLA